MGISSFSLRVTFLCGPHFDCSAMTRAGREGVSVLTWSACAFLVATPTCVATKHVARFFFSCEESNNCNEKERDLRTTTTYHVP